VSVSALVWGHLDHGNEAYTSHNAADDVYNAGRQYSTVNSNGWRTPRHWSFTIRSHEHRTTLFSSMSQIHTHIHIHHLNAHQYSLQKYF